MNIHMATNNDRDQLRLIVQPVVKAYVEWGASLLERTPAGNETQQSKLARERYYGAKTATEAFLVFLYGDTGYGLAWVEQMKAIWDRYRDDPRARLGNWRMEVRAEIEAALVDHLETV